jgi:hypothetical protein
MKKINISGFNIKIVPDSNRFNVSVYKESESMPFTGTIISDKLTAERWALKKIYEQMTNPIPTSLF